MHCEKATTLYDKNHIFGSLKVALAQWTLLRYPARYFQSVWVSERMDVADGDDE
jgi:hypothetical protein